jgi:hypothetical protein
MSELVSKTGGRFDRRAIDAVERGRRPCSDEEIGVLTEGLGIAVARLAPQRVSLHIDRVEGRIDAHAGTGGVASFPAFAENRAILVRYLALVQAMRAGKGSRNVVVRDDDVVVLAEALAMRADEVREMLTDLARESRSEIGKLRDVLGRRPAIIGIGVLVGLTALGALILQSDAESSPRAPDIGSALVLERAAPAEPLADRPFSAPTATRAPEIGSALVLERPAP